ncbi:MAG: hypothetical protein M3083_24870 [Actinomycetota bacterium]|nr:hypothetical protein [Actinomycetota bacterium]MDQ6949193.1 hypothetical protein [Actinomycetota bacterium]
MADNYRQYTSCCAPTAWESLANYLIGATTTLLAVAVATILIAGWCALFYLGVAAAAEAVAACSWWLNKRLVCLGGDRSAAGMLVEIEPAVGKSGYFGELDTDYSINLLLYPNLPGVSQADAEISTPYGELIKDQQSIIDNIGFFQGEMATEPHTHRQSAVLHAEFEGGGVYDFFIGASIALGLYIAAIIACAAIPPPWGVLIAGLLALLALLAWFLSHGLGASDYGGPGDVGAPSELHTNDPNTSVGADLLYVQGTWVFDSFHEGWNEIHPIKKCTPIGTWNGVWPSDIPALVKKLDDGFADALNPLTVGRQKEPTYTWAIHPLIDGCGTYPAADVPPTTDPRGGSILH